MLANKLLPYLVFPLTWTLVLMLLGVVAMIRRRTVIAVLCLGTAWLLLWASSLPVVGQSLLRTLERQTLPMALDTLPEADAIVLLGGAAHAPLPPRRTSEWGDGVDRVLMAARLYRAGKAPLIVVSGGQVFPMPGYRSEADYHVELLMSLGVPESAIWLEGESRNTADNARMVERLVLDAQGDRVLLVTSAFHMPRSLLLFGQTELLVTPVPVDFREPQPARPAILEWMPDADALAMTQLALREYLGLAFYRVRIWLG